MFALVSIALVCVALYLLRDRIAHLVALMLGKCSKRIAEWRIERLVCNERRFASLDGIAGRIGLKGVDVVGIAAICMILGGFASMLTGTIVAGLLSVFVHVPVFYGLVRILFVR